MSTLRLCCALGVLVVVSAGRADAQGYAQQGYDQQQYQQPQYQQQQQQPQGQQQYQQQYPQQQQYQQQQPPPGYFPTPDAQGSYNYQQQYAPNGAYPAQQGAQGQEGAQGSEPAAVTSVQGAIQLGAGIALLQHSSLSYSQTSAPMTAPVAPGAPPPAAAVQPWPVGGFYTEHPLTVEAGYGLSQNLLLGAIVQLSSGSEKFENSGATASVSTMSFTFAPKLDYQFTPSSRWNPFLGAALSFTMTNKRYIAATDSQTLFGVLVRGGFRCFVLDQLSLDPTVSLGYRVGSGSQKTDASPAPLEFKNSMSNFLFAVSLGLSLWVK